VILLALHVLASTAFPQEGEWVELRFHRVHLRNGNCIDGQLLKETPGQVVLQMKFGDMAIRRDQIDFVEFVKMRNREERAVIVKGPNPGGGGGVRPDGTPPPPPDTPEEIRIKVDAILAKLKATPQGSRKFPIEQLRALGEEAGIYLLSRFRELEVEIQGLAATALSIVKFPKTIPLLEALLKDREPRVRATAAMALGLMRDAEKARYLRPLLRDPDAEVRAVVLGMLNSVEEKEWFDPVSELCGDADRDTRNQALQVAGRLATKYKLQDDYLRILGDLLRRGVDEVRIDVAGAVGGLGKPEGWSLLAPLLTESQTAVRAAGAQALMRLAAPDSGPAILSQLPREREKPVRINLAGAVQRLKLRKAVRPLIDWLSDSDDEIRKLAGATLTSLTGQKFGVDRDPWQTWADTTGEK